MAGSSGRKVLGRRRLPASERGKLERDERVIAWSSASASASDSAASESAASESAASDLADAGAVVVTNLGVWLPGRDGRLGWHQIHTVRWSGSRLTVIPSMQVGDGEGYAVMADDATVDVTLADPDGVPAEVRDRVTRSVAYTEHHCVPGGGVRVVARRVPGVDGVTWHVRYDDGTDPGDPEVVAATAELVAAASAH